jgi:hypothetical protein
MRRRKNEFSGHHVCLASHLQCPKAANAFRSDQYIYFSDTCKPILKGLYLLIYKSIHFSIFGPVISTPSMRSFLLIIKLPIPQQTLFVLSMSSYKYCIL